MVIRAYFPLRPFDTRSTSPCGTAWRTPPTPPRPRAVPMTRISRRSAAAQIRRRIPRNRVPPTITSGLPRPSNATWWTLLPTFSFGETETRILSDDPVYPLGDIIRIPDPEGPGALRRASPRNAWSYPAVTHRPRSGFPSASWMQRLETEGADRGGP